jgi:hypothetical protein
MNVLKGHSKGCSEKLALQAWMKNQRRERKVTPKEYGTLDTGAIENCSSNLMNDSELPRAFVSESYIDQESSNYHYHDDGINNDDNVSNLDENSIHEHQFVAPEIILNQDDGTNLNSYGDLTWYKFQQKLIQKALDINKIHGKNRRNSDGFKADGFTDNVLNELQSKLKLSGAGITLVCETIKTLNAHNKVSYYVPSNFEVISSHLQNVLMDENINEEGKMEHSNLFELI